MSRKFAEESGEVIMKYLVLAIFLSGCSGLSLVEECDSEGYDMFTPANDQCVARKQQRNLEIGNRLVNWGNSMKPASAAPSCMSGSLAPLAMPGCRNVCINGAWAQVCD